jgi:aryl sulfotransferase
MRQLLEAQSHRRFLKSHLPFDGLPYYDQLRYIHVARDGRDLCMSAFNHHGALTRAFYESIEGLATGALGPFPPCPDDPRVYWRDWLTRGVQAGETDGFPDLSFFNLEATFWRARSTENLLLVHYNDLKADLEGEMRRIATFLSIEPPEALWPGLVEAATFDAMRRNGATLMSQGAENFEGGSSRFLYKGTNGRWRDVMTTEDIALYDQVAATRMTPGLGRWIEGGRLGAGEPRNATD